MHKKNYRTNKNFKAIIALTVLSTILSGCNKKFDTPSNTGSSNESMPNITLDTANKSLSDLFPSDLTENDSSENNDKNTYSHTIMIYMVGSDLESRYGSATADLEEMLAANPDTQNNNIVVFTGGASRWRSHGIEADKSYILELTNKDFAIKESTDSCNMGEPENLSNFINYCFDKYDTDKYSLILWNHGAGPVIGFGVDENYSDILSLTELKAALDLSVGKSGNKLELIGFDEFS